MTRETCRSAVCSQEEDQLNRKSIVVKRGLKSCLQSNESILVCELDRSPPSIGLMRLFFWGLIIATFYELCLHGDVDIERETFKFNKGTLSQNPNIEIWQFPSDPHYRITTGYFTDYNWSRDGRYLSYNQGIIDLNSTEDGRNVVFKTSGGVRWGKRSNLVVGKDDSRLYMFDFADGDPTNRSIITTVKNDLVTSNQSYSRLGGIDHLDQYIYVWYTEDRLTRYRLERDGIKEILGVPGSNPVPNRFYPVVNIKGVGEDTHAATIGGTNDEGVVSGGISIPLDGSVINWMNPSLMRHHSNWLGDGSYYVCGDGFVRGRKWDEPYHDVITGDYSNIHILSIAEMGDFNDLGWSGRWAVGGGNDADHISVGDLRFGGGGFFLHPFSLVALPGDNGNNSSYYDASPKGSPDGTKINFYTQADLANLRVSFVAIEQDGDVIQVDSTDDFPESGYLLQSESNGPILHYTSKTSNSFQGVTSGHFGTRIRTAEVGDWLVPLEDRLIPEEEFNPTGRDDSRHMVTRFGRENPPARQMGSRLVIAVVKSPDRPWLRLVDSTLELIPGENHRETAGYRIYLNGVALRDELFAPGEISLEESGSYTAVAVEWSGLESEHSNIVEISDSIEYGEILSEIPQDFSWTYDRWLALDKTSGQLRESFNRRGILKARNSEKETIHRVDGLISRTKYWKGHRTSHQDFDADGNPVRSLFYQNSKLTKREYLNQDGLPITIEHFDRNGFITDTITLEKNGVRETLEDPHRHWFYDRGKVVRVFSRVKSSRYAPDGAGTYESVNGEWTEINRWLVPMEHPDRPSEISLSPSVLDMFSTRVGTSVERSISLTNHSDQDRVLKAEIDSNAFSLEGSGRYTIPANGSISIQITFHAISQGMHSTDIQWSNGDSFTVYGSGTKGSSIEIAQQYKDLNLVQGQSGELTYVIENVGDEKLRIQFSNQPREDSSPFLVSNDPNLQEQWYHTDAYNGTQSAWPKYQASEDIVVAIFDTGVDLDHPDLNTQIWINDGEIEGDGIDNDGNGYIDDIHGWNFFDNNANVEDEHGRGTALAGIIGASGNNHIGIMGVHGDVQMAILKVMNEDMETNLDSIEHAMEYCLKMGFHIAIQNIHLKESSDKLLQLYTKAQDSGLLIVLGAVGDNLNQDLTVTYPISYDFNNAIVVGGYDRNWTISDSSAHGPFSIDIYAPSDDIFTTSIDGDYGEWSDVSMAAAQVAGAASLVQAQKAYISSLQVIQTILDNSRGNIKLRDGIVGGRSLSLFDESSLSNNSPWISLPINEMVINPGESKEIQIDINSSWVFPNSQNIDFGFTSNDEHQPQFFFGANVLVSSNVPIGNLAPIVNSSPIETWIGHSKNLMIDAIDPEGGEVHYALKEEPVLGTLSGDFPNLVYHANRGLYGSEVIKFVVKDEFSASRELSVPITVHELDVIYFDKNSILSFEGNKTKVSISREGKSLNAMDINFRWENDELGLGLYQTEPHSIPSVHFAQGIKGPFAIYIDKPNDDIYYSDSRWALSMEVDDPFTVKSSEYSQVQVLFNEDDEILCSKLPTSCQIVESCSFPLRFNLSASPNTPQKINVIATGPIEASLTGNSQVTLANYRQQRFLNITALKDDNSIDDSAEVSIWLGDKVIHQLSIDVFEPSTSVSWLLSERSIDINEGETKHFFMFLSAPTSEINHVDWMKRTDESLRWSGNAFSREPSQWNVPIELSITAEHDLDDLDERFQWSFTEVGGGVKDIQINVMDDDVIGIVVDPQSNEVIPGSNTIAGIYLSAKPQNSIDVEIAVTQNLRLYSPSVITITPDKWDIRHLVSVSCLDDLTEPKFGKVSFSSSMLRKKNWKLTCLPEGAPKLHAESRIDIPEGQTVVLEIESDASIFEMNLQNSKSFHGALEPATGHREGYQLELTSLSDDNDIDERDIVNLQLGKYTLSRWVQNIDHEELGLQLSSQRVLLQEGREEVSDGIDLKLSAEPKHPIEIEVRDQSNLSSFNVFPKYLYFDQLNWNEAQKIYLSYSSDEDVIDESFSLSLTGLDEHNIDVNVYDDDSPLKFTKIKVLKSPIIEFEDFVVEVNLSHVELLEIRDMLQIHINGVLHELVWDDMRGYVTSVAPMKGRLDIELSSTRNPGIKRTIEKRVFPKPKVPMMSLLSLKDSLASVVDQMDTSTDSESGANLLTDILKDNADTQWMKAVEGLLSTIGAGEYKTYQSGDSYFTIVDIVDSTKSYQNNDPDFEMTLEDLPQDLVLMMGTVPSQSFDNLPEDHIGKTIFLELRDGTEDIEAGFSVTKRLKDIPYSDTPPTLYVLSDNGYFIESGFETSWEGSELVVVLDHFSVYTLAKTVVFENLDVEEEDQEIITEDVSHVDSLDQIDSLDLSPETNDLLEVNTSENGSSIPAIETELENLDIQEDLNQEENEIQLEDSTASSEGSSGGGGGGCLLRR